MKKFYLTFGQKYAQEDHPNGEWIHPDGVVCITAEDYAAAREIVVDLFGLAWSDLYDPETFGGFVDLHPKGVLLNIQVPEKGEAKSDVD